MPHEYTWLFGRFCFDGRLLYRGAKRLEVLERDACVLRALLERHRGLVAREELLPIYGRSADPNSLDQGISRLRKVLGDRARGPARGRGWVYIDTVQGSGFVFVYAGVRRGEPLSSMSRGYYEAGLALWNRREARSLCMAREYLEEAIQRDPTYGAAYAARADCIAIDGSYWWTSPGEAAAKAEAAAKQALRLDPGLHQPHATLGFVESLFQHKWSQATRSFKNSIARNREYGTAYHWHALLLSATGDRLRAIKAISKARKCDPDSRIIEAHAAAVLYWARLYDLAEEQCHRAMYDRKFWYAHHLLGLVYEQQGRLEDALDKQHEAVERYPGRSTMLVAALARAYASCGARSAAVRELDSLNALGGSGTALYHSTTAYAALGETGAAFAHLQTACERSDVWASFLAVDPRLDGLRGDRRFSGLLRKLDLPAAVTRASALGRKEITMVRSWLEL